jgi:F-type H+-transporting ATPase subunit gamma
MAKPRELKRRIRSVGKTRQITRTMEMVSTSKLKRATDRVHAARPYAQKLTEVLGRLIDPDLFEQFPLLRQPERVKRAAVIVITSSRGLAGAFNANLIKEGRHLMERLAGVGVEVELHAVGKKCVSFFRFRRQPMATARIDITDRPTMEDAISVIDPLRERFELGQLDEIHIVHAQFRSAMSTPPGILRVLPIQPPAAADAVESHAQWLSNYSMSPSVGAILERLLPLYVRNAMYRALVETAAAEHGARRAAMKNATDSASDMLDYLNRTYNRARQAQITQEIAEIVGGAAALE